MGIRLGILFGILAAVGALPQAGLAAITTGYASAGGFQVAAGVDYDFGSVIVGGSARRSINILAIDPTESLTGMRLSLANGSASAGATTVEQALANSSNGHRVVATVNGSLFSYFRRDGLVPAVMGLGLNVSDGELINAGNPSGRLDLLPAFAINEIGNPMIGTPDLAASLTLPGGELVSVDRINQMRFGGDVVLYTPTFGEHAWTDSLGDEYVIEGFDLPLRPTGTYSGTVVAVRQDAGDTPIEAGQVVLSVSNTADPWATELSVGSAVTLSLTVDEGWEDVSLSVGGRNMLVVDGMNVTPQPDVDGSHARTVVGIDATGKVMLVTVDPDTSLRGLRLTEAAELMISLGAVDAANLDGGGSTQMAVRHPGDVDVAIVTPPGESGMYRPVSNALQIVSDAPDGPLDRLLLAPDRATVTVGENIDFVAKGQDAVFNGLELDGSALGWSVERAADGSGGPSFTTQGAVISMTGTQVGDYLVTVRLDALEATAPLNVIADTTPPVASVSRVAFADTGLVANDRATLQVDWTAQDNVAIARVQVQRRVDSGSWRSVAVSGGPGAGSATSTARFGRKVQFRARATDAAGNTGAWTLGAPVRVLLFNDTHNGIGRTGAWARKVDEAAIGGQFLRSRTAAADASLTVKALQLAVIGNGGPSHGTASIYLNGSLTSSMSLQANSVQARRLIYVSPLLADARMTVVRMVNTSAGAQKLVDLDAFLALVAD